MMAAIGCGCDCRDFGKVGGDLGFPSSQGCPRVYSVPMGLSILAYISSEISYDSMKLGQVYMAAAVECLKALTLYYHNFYTSHSRSGILVSLTFLPPWVTECGSRLQQYIETEVNAI